MRIISEAAEYVLNHPRFTAEQRRKDGNQPGNSASVNSELWWRLWSRSLDCPSAAVIRHKYFSSTTLKELFSNVDARCILDFTTESGFYQAI